MAASRPTLAIAPEQPEIPAGLLRVCFALCVVNLTLGVVAYFSHWWIYDSDGLGIPSSEDRLRLDQADPAPGADDVE